MLTKRNASFDLTKHALDEIEIELIREKRRNLIHNAFDLITAACVALALVFLAVMS